MRFNGLSAISSAILICWLLLYVVCGFLGLGAGAATIFLPASIVMLLIHQLRSRRPPFDLTIVFLVSCLFFFCISLILWPISSFPPTEVDSLVVTTLPMAELDLAAILVGTSITITILTMSLCRGMRSFRVPNVFQPDEDKRTPRLYRIGIRLILISLPAVGIELWQQFRYVQEAGYLALYIDGVQTSRSTAPFFYLFHFGFGLALTFARKRSEFLVPAALYIAAAMLESLKGARGAVLVPMLFVAWYYCSRFKVTVHLRVVVRNMVLVIATFVVLTYQRDPELLTSGVAQFLVDAVSSQGRSLQLVALYRQVAEEVALYGSNMVLSNLFIPITAILHPEVREAAQSMDQVLFSNNLKHILTYVLNPNYYFAGGGTGGVYTIELIEAGLIMYVLLSIGLGWFLAWLPRAMRRSWVRYLSVYFFATVFYLPRGEFFFNTLIVGKALFLYLAVTALYRRHRCRQRSGHVPAHAATSPSI